MKSSRTEIHSRPRGGLVLKAVVELSEIVKGREHRQPRDLGLVEVILASPASQTAPEDGGAQQSLTARGYVSAVRGQRVPPRLGVRAELSPK